MIVKIKIVCRERSKVGSQVKPKSIGFLGLDNEIGGASLWDPAVRSRGTSMGLVHKRPTSTNTVPFYVHTLKHTGTCKLVFAVSMAPDST